MSNVTLTQKFFLRILPKAWAQDMESESRKWMIRCSACGYERSVWDAGGIRWRPTPGDKTVLIYCPECRQVKWSKMTKVEGAKS